MNIKGETVEAKRCRKDLWTIGAKNTALVVVDIEMGHKLKRTGSVLNNADDPEAVFRKINEEMVPRINELAAACRLVRIPVIWICGGRRPDFSDSGVQVDMSDHLASHRNPADPSWVKMVDLHPDLNVLPQDYIVKKRRYSAFIHGSSELELLLRGLGRNSFIAVGEATDVCLGTTVMDGMMLDFKVFVVSDLTATFTEARQKAALYLLDRHFARVITFSEALGDLAQLAEKEKV